MVLAAALQTEAAAYVAKVTAFRCTRSPTGHNSPPGSQPL
jgi:hypothetical protein